MKLLRFWEFADLTQQLADEDDDGLSYVLRKAQRCAHQHASARRHFRVIPSPATLHQPLIIGGCLHAFQRRILTRLGGLPLVAVGGTLGILTARFDPLLSMRLIAAAAILLQYVIPAGLGIILLLNLWNRMDHPNVVATVVVGLPCLALLRLLLDVAPIAARLSISAQYSLAFAINFIGAMLLAVGWLFALNVFFALWPRGEHALAG